MLCRNIGPFTSDKKVLGIIYATCTLHPAPANDFALLLKCLKNMDLNVPYMLFLKPVLVKGPVIGSIYTPI